MAPMRASWSSEPRARSRWPQLPRSVTVPVAALVLFAGIVFLVGVSVVFAPVCVTRQTIRGSSVPKGVLLVAVEPAASDAASVGKTSAQLGHAFTFGSALSSIRVRSTNSVLPSPSIEVAKLLPMRSTPDDGRN